MKVGVIGAGVMGRGITIDLVMSGHSVILVDNSENNLEEARKEVEQGLRIWGIYKKEKRLVNAKQAFSKVTFVTDLYKLVDSEFIIESITENYEMKKSLYQQLDKIIRPEVVFAINSSCISIDRIAALTNRRDRVIGMHFMNPVILKSTIEMIKGFYTSEETVQIAQDLLKSLDKQYILVEDSPGFASNRVSHLFINEACYVVMDGICTVEQLDKIFRECFGHSMGPLQTADLIGIDTVVNALDVLYESYHDSKFRCCPLLRQMVYRGKLGKKTGEGFYLYRVK